MSRLHQAVRDNNVDLVRQLITVEGENIDVNFNYDNRIPLHIASFYGYLEIVNLLISANADLNVKDKKHGLTALYIALQQGHVEIVKSLIAAGANVKDILDKTPLHYASGIGFLEIVKVLITIEGIDINVKNSAGDTPLHYASGYGHPEIVKVLIFAGAEVNIKNNYGKTPLDIALENQRYEIVEILKKALEDQHPIKEPDV